MNRMSVWVYALIVLAGSVLPMAAQQPAAASATATVPPIVHFSGVLNGVNGKPLTGTVGVTFYLYQASEGGTPLWMETQNVQVDKAGHYSVALGSTSGQGLPISLFASGEARWLGVQVHGQDEQPRVLLMSVPYAMKALDAETIGGRPASSFMLAPTANSKAPAVPPGTITGSGTADFVPIFTGTTTIGNSKVFQTVGGDIGIGTTTPVATLDVKGTGDVRDTLTLFPKLTHNALSVHGTAFEVSHTGLVTFISGQTFPGTGTVTSVGSGAGLTGGPITTSGTLSIKTAGVTNAMLAHSSLTVTANSPLTGGGSVSLGGTTSLGLTSSCSSGQILKWNGSSWNCAADNNSGGTVTSVATGTGLTGGTITTSGTISINTSVVPELAAANTFTNQNAISVSSSSTALTVANPSSGDGIDVTSGSGFGVLVNNTGIGVVVENSDIPILAEAPSTGEESVLAFAEDDSSFLPAIYGIEEGSTTRTVGVEGLTDSTIGYGVYGQNVSESSTGGSCSSHFIACQAGVWGDGGTTTANSGVLGTVDDGFAGFFVNNGSEDTLVAWAESSSGSPFFAGNLANGTNCSINSSGDLSCTGSKNAVVPVDGGARTVALSAIESPMNWFEDFGSAQLVNGVAVVSLDPVFIQTVNSELDYKVFPVPNGDCKGLYITHKTATSFEVRELGGGTSSVAFDYRITALRKNYENVRFADHTHDLDSMKRMLRNGPAIPTKAPATPPRPRVHTAGRMAQLNGVVKH
jgi:hypothetical protein